MIHISEQNSPDYSHHFSLHAQDPAVISQLKARMDVWQCGLSGEAKKVVENEIQELELSLRLWVDSMPLTVKKRKMADDFSNGYGIGEIGQFYFPRLISVRSLDKNVSSLARKRNNWASLQIVVFREIGFEAGQDLVELLIRGNPEAMSYFLTIYQLQISKFIPIYLSVYPKNN